MWLLGSALADVVVTIFLIFSLRSRIAGFKASTDQMLRRLIFLAVESASYTAICAFIPAMLVVFISKTAAYVAVYSAFIRRPFLLASFVFRANKKIFFPSWSLSFSSSVITLPTFIIQES